MVDTVLALQLRTLAAAQEWDALEALAQEKRSAIGYLPFITVARAEGAPQPVIARFRHCYLVDLHKRCVHKPRPVGFR